MEVLRLGVESKLQLPAYATATAMPDLSSICNLCCSLQQCGILNPLSEARDQTCNLMVPRENRFCHALMGTPGLVFFFLFVCFFVFLGPRPWHMEVLRLGVELEVQLLAYTTATAMSLDHTLL